VQWVLQQAQAAAGAGVLLERRADEAVSVERSGDRSVIEFRASSRAIASCVVLALGNFLPADPACAEAAAVESPRYLRDPWDIGRYEALDRARPVLLLGTGLTAVDVVLELAARGWDAPIYAISRRGLLPQPHRSPAKPVHPEPPGDLARWEATAKGLLRALRREVEAQARRGIDWREVVTSIRADTARLWQAMDLEERRRFLGRLRAYWDTHRHRAAPQAWSALDGMMRTGRLRISAARLCGLRFRGDGFEAVIRARGGEHSELLPVGGVINCTGPETDLQKVANPLVRSLLSRGTLRGDALGLGLDAEESGAVIDAAGHASNWLYAVGPLRRGQLWETTAVPELRVQAAEVARAVMGEATIQAGY
jgi:uncharacterized NAD(P)/FAD-binding protein YdhS